VTDHEELAAIAADVRAWLAAADARGWRIDPSGDEPAPRDIEPEIAVPAPDVEVPSAWGRIAAAAREVHDPVRALQLLRDDIGDCRRCNLCKERTQIVYGAGDPTAHLLLVGEAPGYDEDVKGDPLLGEAGAMLDKMLSNVLGLSRGEVYLLNVVKCRTPKGRAPQADEIAACRPFLERQIAAIGPKVVVALGATAASALLGASRESRGVWHSFEGIPTLPTFHPTHLMKVAADKRLAFEDLKAVRQRYDALGGKRSAFKLS